MPVETPEWVKDAVFYHIFPDRFAKSERVAKPSHIAPWESPPSHRAFMGGDLIGIVEHLDYLVDLGINAIYLNPIFQASSTHRYNTHDYFHVDPILGGNAALRMLLDSAHQRGIRIVLDGVFNHCGRGFFQFNHLLECGAQSPYVDWFDIQDGFPLNAYQRGANPNYRAWFGSRMLPEFNTDNPAVRQFIFDVAEHWIRFGIDGWRLDAPEKIDDDSFWQDFRTRVKAINPEAYIVGEIWDEGDRWLQGDQFDAVTNYLFLRPVIGFFGAETLADLNQEGGHAPIPAWDAASFARDIETALHRYDWSVTLVQLNIIGSHDTPRFLTMVGGDQSALQLAILCMMTMPGAPCVYYGDEIGMEGGYDPDCRRAMPWEQAAAKSDLWRHVQRAIALRHDYPVLRRGSYVTVLAEDKLLAYTRELDGDRALIVFNTDRNRARVELPVGGLSNVVFGNPSGHLFLGTNQTKLTVPARSGVVLI